MTETVTANQGSALSTRYTLMEKLGAGGQAEVWRATDLVAGMEVALKVLVPSVAHDEAAWAALVREHAIASRLDCPSILKIQPPYREGDFIALPMELAAGGDLRKLRGKGYLDVIPVLIDIAQALEYAHEHGVIHRDLKPGNILFDARGRVRIADFGIAAAPGEGGTLVRPGFSPFTASPEQLRGDPPSIADDIYGLGALAYELLSGYPPYYPRFEVRRALEEPVPELKPVQQMPHQLVATVMRMLSKRVQLRPRSMRDVIDDFDAALNDTLTFDFDHISESDGPSGTLRRGASVLAAAEAARRPLPPVANDAGPPAREVARVGVSTPFRSRSEAMPRTIAPSVNAVDESVRVTGALAKQSAAPTRTATGAPPARPSEPRRAPPASSAPSRNGKDDHSAHPRAVPPVEATPHASRKAGDSDALDANEVAAARWEHADHPVPVLTQLPDSLARPLPQAATRGAGGAGPLSSAQVAAQPAAQTSEGHAVVEEAPRTATTRNTGGGLTVESFRIAEAAAAVRDAAPHFSSPGRNAPTFWDDARLQVDDVPRHRATRYIGSQAFQVPPPRKSWPWVVLTALVAAASLVFFVLPKYGSVQAVVDSAESALPIGKSASALASDASSVVSGADQKAGTPSGLVGTPATAAPSTASAPGKVSATARSPPPAPVAAGTSAPAAAGRSAPAAAPLPAVAQMDTPEQAEPAALKEARAGFDKRLASLEARGAGVWGGPDFAAAKMRAAESVGAADAGNMRIANARLNDALRLLSKVEAQATQTLASQLTIGETALAAGQQDVARQAFDSARRIDPTNRRALEGLSRTRNLGGVLPLLADGQNAEAAQDYARAVQDYSQALSLDPRNAAAKAGLDRAHAAFGDDAYAKSVGTGFAALGAGRLEAAREAFEKARSVKPNGAEAAAGLARVGAALSARGYASTRQKGAALEAEERWSDAAKEYEAALQVDPSLVFAQQGRARALARADLASSLQALIDRPERLASPSVRTEAETLIKRAAGQDPMGPVLRSQVQRLQILLPGFDVPVRLEMVSDNATQVQIQRVGTFGSFNRRQIELKPGKYTVVGTRPGFRDVRRDVTIAPGGTVQTISVSCVEPI